MLKPEYVASVAALCKENGLMLHMDGARIMNAAVVLELTGIEILNLTYPLSQPPPLLV